MAPSREIQDDLASARALADAGQLGEAEARFRELLDSELPGAFDREYVLGSLMTVFSRGWRVYETLILARHLTEHLRAREQPAAAAGCLATYCESLLEVGPDDLLEARLDELGLLLDEVEMGAGAMPREAYHNCGFKLAIQRKDIRSAKRHMEHYRAFVPSIDGRPWRKAVYLALNDVELDLLTGMPHRALEGVDTAARLAGGHAEPQTLIAWNRLRCLIRLDRPIETEAAARRYLELLEANGRDTSRLPNQLRNAARLAEWCRDRDGLDDVIRGAYQIAGAAIVARIPQLDAAVQELAGYGVAENGAADDLALLRKHFVADQSHLLAQVASYLAQDPDLLRSLRVRDDAGGELVHLCAWCERVMTADGRWIPVGHFIPRDGPALISHAICEPCLEEMSS